MTPVIKLCNKLQTEYNVIAYPDTFRRTYAGKNLKAAGAFTWMMDGHNDKGPMIIAGFEPVSKIIRKGTKCTFEQYEEEWQRTYVIETD